MKRLAAADEKHSHPPRRKVPFGNLFWLASGGIFPQAFLFARMKAKIIITPKKAVLDPQGKTVQTALEHMGYTGVTGVHIGKYIEIDLAPGTDKAAAQKALNDAAFKLLSNPVIEDYKLEIE
jgi:phosphoribosylformylglycinamidine synthase